MGRKLFYAGSMSTTPGKVDARAIDEARARLHKAAVTGKPCAPVRDLIGRDDVASAYAVQRLGIQARVGAGARAVGRKIGLTSEAVQRQIGVDRPDFGVLLDDMVYADGDEAPIGRFLQPRVEAEVAFVLKGDLDLGDVSLERLRAAIDYAVPALEICDSRVAGWDITFGDTVADNASAGGYVLGSAHRRLDEFDPRGVSMRMTVTGQEESTGVGSDCLGDPLLAVQWLARQARELGDPLRAGEVILSGALGPMRAVAPGAVADATISGLGTVSVSFSKGDKSGKGGKA